VKAATEAAAAVQEAGKAMVAFTPEEVVGFATPLTVLEQVEKLAAAALPKQDAVRTQLKELIGEVAKMTPPNPAIIMARKELTKLVQSLEAEARDCKKTASLVNQRCGSICQKLSSSASEALRKETRSKGTDCDKLFEELAKGADRISEKDFCAKIQAVASAQPEHATLLCHQIEKGGLSRRSFLGLVQQFFSVVKDIAITNDVDVSAGKSLRKLEKAELIEVVGEFTTDEGGIARIKGRAVKDNLEGWVTVKGNQGTPFLMEVEKPFYTIANDTTLEKDFKPESEAARTLKAEEILELLEGPRKEPIPDAVRARVKASSDDATGWVTLSGRCGTVFAEPNKKLFIVTGSVAMTDAQNIKDCKVVRKLAVGELFDTIGEPAEDTESGVWRVEGVAKKDGKKGWCTTKGNAGTVYAEVSSKYYSVLKEIPLQQKFPTEAAGDDVRMIAVGEALNVLEGPKVEPSPAQVRVKVRAAKDGAVGWMTRKEKNVILWTPIYKVAAPVPIHNQQNPEGAEVVRELIKGEKFELLEGPTEEGSLLRFRGRAVKDNAAGWVTLKDAEGKKFFDH